MMLRPTKRLLLGGAAGVVAFLVATVTLGGVIKSFETPDATASIERQIGGPFSMVDQNGRVVTEADFAEKPKAMFFGFTSCPDVCPTMLYQMTVWLKELGPLADRISPIFVSVDPDRDTPSVIRDYLTAFDPRITGLTGTPRQLAAFARNHGIVYEKVPVDDGEYTVNHTAGILLFDADGAYRGTADYHDDPADA